MLLRGLVLRERWCLITEPTQDKLIPLLPPRRRILHRANALGVPVVLMSGRAADVKLRNSARHQTAVGQGRYYARPSTAILK
jgi:hypothetical protein